MAMFGFVPQATIGGDDLSRHALPTCRASTSASCTRLRHVLGMMEIEKLWVQEDEQQEDEGEHWRQNEDDKIITLIDCLGSDINNTSIHAERTFRPTGWMMSRLGDQVCVQGAVDLNNEQPIKTGSFLKTIEVKIIKPRIQEEKHWRQNEDDKIITLIDCPGGDINNTAIHAERTFRPTGWMMSRLGDQVCVQGAVDLNNEQPIKTGSFLKTIEVKIIKPRIQEEKQGRDQDGDDEITTIGSNDENAALNVIVLLLIAQAAANSCQFTLQPGDTAQDGPSCPQKVKATAPIRYKASRQPGLLTRACLLMMILQPAMAQGAQSSTSESVTVVSPRIDS